MPGLGLLMTSLIKNLSQKSSVLSLHQKKTLIASKLNLIKLLNPMEKFWMNKNQKNLKNQKKLKQRPRNNENDTIIIKLWLIENSF